MWAKMPSTRSCIATNRITLYIVTSRLQNYICATVKDKLRQLTLLFSKEVKGFDDSILANCGNL